ncbi:type II toxin-antitoxin system HicA family toxin [Criibacterium bergeronii]|uniref:Type II toxin-antitoxin system HicA family toxin n=1 Tax=Criibacterium bergeronii TaxID=1871336 RepID=A0A371IIW6_9FIRM|nr:type II toxin-antitoxin system HicA family toxin [Criibacterium bergeronii]RDY20424.1 type II toxin-antitoxin system HicA family toxin [Criibacterium bergeronii]
MANTKTYKEVVKILLKNGYILDHTTGSHEIYINDLGVICPVKCTKKDIPAGTLANIKRITGLNF